MKNRLQIRYHIPESLPTRAQAMAYLKEAFAIGRTNSTNASLPAEPLVLLYNDIQVDAVKGITEAQRLATSNVLLAIGRGGDGSNIFNNQDYFVIDFAKHSEEILQNATDIANIQSVITEIEQTIAEMKSAIKDNADNISDIVKKIGEKGDNSEKDTIYGYIQGAYENISTEKNRAEDAEQDLTHAIENEETRAKGEEARIESVLTHAIEDVKTAVEDTKKKVENEETRAKAEEARIEARLDSEIARSAEKDGKLDSDIASLNTKADDLQAQITSEVKARESADNELQKQITSNLNAITNNTSEINKNRVKSENKTIVVTAPTSEGTNLEVNIDGTTIVTDNNGRLSVDANSLVKGENAVVVSDVVGTTKTISLKINPNDKVLTNDVNGLLATLSLKWVKATVDGEKDEIQLIGNGDNVLSRIDVADFIKDGMLDSVSLDTTTNPTNPSLVFVFNSAAGKETIRISVKDLIDVYHAGNGLSLNEQTYTFSVVIDNASEFLSVSPNGIKVSGVTNKINEVVTAEKTRAEGVEQELRNAIATNNNALTNKINEVVTAEKTRAEGAEQELRGAIATNNNTLTKLTGDVSVEGSVKDTIFETALGNVVTSLSVDDAREQSLMRKFTLDGTPYLYVSNNSADIKHNGDALSNVVDTLRGDLDVTMDNTETLKDNLSALTTTVNQQADKLEEVAQTLTTNVADVQTLKTDVEALKSDVKGIRDMLAPMQATIELLQTSLATTQANLATAMASLETLKTTAITEINGTANEITVSKSGNTATVGFATDAYFVAGI
jgi:hypothetical protein